MSALALAFEGGLLYRSGAESPEPLVIRIPDYPPEAAPVPVSGQSSGLEAVSATVSGSAPTEAGECRFVGSRNSDKYHLPHCAAAKRIKPENLRCFSSQEEARAAGYLPGCLQ